MARPGEVVYRVPPAKGAAGTTAGAAPQQAAAAADNLLKGLRGETPTATFKVELICIVDAIDHGTLVFRNTRRQIILPSSRLFHWAKRFFEGVYLRKYR